MYVKIKTLSGRFLYVNGDCVQYIEVEGEGADDQYTHIILRDGETIARDLPVREAVRMFNDGVYADE